MANDVNSMRHLMAEFNNNVPLTEGQIKQVEEAEAVSEIIVPGFGSWDERTLRQNMNGRLKKIMNAAKDGNYGNVAHDADILAVQAKAYHQFMDSKEEVTEEGDGDRKKMQIKKKVEELRELGVPEDSIARIVKAATSSLNESAIFEDNWWTNKAKKAVGKVAGKFSSVQQGKLEARQRADELMHEYKKAIGGGLATTLQGLLDWLESGNDPKADRIIKQLNMRGSDASRAAQLSISDARDFLIKYAGLENQEGVENKNNRSALKKDPNAAKQSKGSFTEPQQKEILGLINFALNQNNP